ncbi:MAG: HU family DNA-binding protein [Bacilli bacterium]|nr:HU family DNA-binding protein [Bacilli bacterium]
MTKTDLVNFVAEDAGLTKAQAARALDAVEAGVKKGLKKEGKVTITGFCTFVAKEKAATTARNPRTGETVKVPAKTAVTIKAGSKLKEALN